MTYTVHHRKYIQRTLSANSCIDSGDSPSLLRTASYPPVQCSVLLIASTSIRLAEQQTDHHRAGSRQIQLYHRADRTTSYSWYFSTMRVPARAKMGLSQVTVFPQPIFLLVIGFVLIYLILFTLRVFLMNIENFLLSYPCTCGDWQSQIFTIFRTAAIYPPFFVVDFR